MCDASNINVMEIWFLIDLIAMSRFWFFNPKYTVCAKICLHNMTNLSAQVTLNKNEDVGKMTLIVYMSPILISFFKGMFRFCV